MPAWLEQQIYNKMSSVISVIFLLTLTITISTVEGQYDIGNCPVLDSTFELITGWMYSAPQDILETRAGSLQLAECLQACKTTQSCQALNFETGLCVLFRSQAGEKQDALMRSQFPVFTMYAQKLCLPSARSCTRAWAFELVRGYSLRGPGTKKMEMPSRMGCMDACLQEREFSCRSAWWDGSNGECVMSDMDRYSINSVSQFTPGAQVEYMESQCAPEPNKQCEFKKLENRLLKTVDSLQEGVGSLEECRQLCLNAPFRCHTFDFEGVCRLSHHSTTTVTQIEEPYLIMNGSASWERGACYNVALDCRATQLVASLTTNKIFNGKVYSRSRPKSCVVDVVNSLSFEMRMDYADTACGVRQEEPGRFAVDLVLQHHDQIMTSADLGFALRCSFHLENRSVAHGIELQVNGQIQSMASESATVPAPNVTMRITNRVGGDIATAQVGDPLSLRFEIMDYDSPYEIFVRELIAMDGADGAEILLIDSRGCPTDPSIMGSVFQVDNKGKALQAPFEAFKFPTSEVVQFQALVTPCLPKCQPVNCTLPSDPSTGGVFKSQSYGRRKRRSASTPSSNDKQENVLVVNSIKISDPFKPPQSIEKSLVEQGYDSEWNKKNDDSDVMTSRTGTTSGATCLNVMGIFLTGSLLLIIQLAVIVAWLYLWRRKRSMSKLDELHPATSPRHYFYASSTQKLPANQPQFPRKFLRQIGSQLGSSPIKSNQNESK